MAGGSDQEIAEIKQRLALIEAHLEQIFTHLQLQPLDPAAMGPSEKVLELVRAGKQIEAVKIHREETGLGLKESKDAIDELFEAEGS